ncbi:Vitamin B12-binding protein [archaeon HR06]|nr:Vitamin B12-binding protein [archaeon HR06]
MIIKENVIVDDSNFEVEVKDYGKIISLAPSNTEIIYSLGLDNKLIGVTKFCNWPMEVTERIANGELKVIGGFYDPDIELIKKLNPDLILGTLGIQKKVIEDLRSKGLQVIAIYPKNLEDIFMSIEALGFLFYKKYEAKKIISYMREKISEISKITSKSHKKFLYYELANYGNRLVTWGGGHWSKDLANLANIKGIFDDDPSQFVIFQPYAILDKKVDVILARKKYTKKEEVISRDGWGKLDAIKENKIYLVDCFTNYSIAYRPSIRILQGLKVLAYTVHDELREEIKDIAIPYVDECQAY